VPFTAPGYMSDLQLMLLGHFCYKIERLLWLCEVEQVGVRWGSRSQSRCDPVSHLSHRFFLFCRNPVHHQHSIDCERSCSHDLPELVDIPSHIDQLSAPTVHRRPLRVTGTMGFMFVTTGLEGQTKRSISGNICHRKYENLKTESSISIPDSPW
jgi:hypothetical protein